MPKRLVLVPLLAIALAACSGSTTTTSSSPTAASPTPALTEAPTPSAEPSPSVAPSEPPSPSPDTSAAAGPAGEAFVDPEGLYRLTVDDAWEPRHGAIAQGIEVWLTHPIADGFAPNVNILTQATGNMTLDEYTQASIDNAPTFIQDFELADTSTVSGPGGELAVVEYSGKAGGAEQPLRFLAVWTVHEGNGIVATFTSLEEHFETQRDEVLPYLLTLEPT
jgi:hypothetical protein